LKDIMTKELVIVESPAKARTVAKFLGEGYSVKASVGHVRDLPKSGLGVDVENGFVPKYVIPKGKRTVVRELKKAAVGASKIYLATDPDREGEAISWHLVKAADLKKGAVRRVVFHAVTEEAIKEAFHHSREIDMRLVDAQQARRVLDRLVGYKISPLLWRKIRRGLSAGRVQSVALRMIVEREREIQGFTSQEYWTIEAELAKKLAKNAPSFRAKLVGLGKGKLELHNQREAEYTAGRIRRATYLVDKVSKKEASRQPAPPFITSTLQQEAWRKLRFTAQRTMSVAQQLYEGLSVGEEGVVGLITYMRTDSTRVVETAIGETRAYVEKKFGAEFLPKRPRSFTRKVKGAQEAHEAIRPTQIEREPEKIKPHLSSDQVRLYELIWKRMLASQMAAALFDTTTANIEANIPRGKEVYLFRAASSTLRFSGFLLVYSEGKDDAKTDAEETVSLPDLAGGEELKLLDIFPEQHFTQPPPRYTEATLVRALEEKGIGRPSTYAPIISTLQRRDYVERKGGRFYPEDMGMTVTDVLVAHFPAIVDIGFTAQMEQRLDEVAQGQLGWVAVVQDFYTPFEETLRKADAEMERLKVAAQPTDEVCPNCGRAMVIRMGRYGRFLACSGYPRCKTTRPLPSELEEHDEVEREVVSAVVER